MLQAYSAFHNYSIGNALLALEQCDRCRLQPAPLNTYRGWPERKRQVRKGQTGIALCMPMPFARTASIDETGEEPVKPKIRHAFRLRAHWFVLAQTEGEATEGTPIPGFDLETALRSLHRRSVISSNVRFWQ